MLWTIDIKKVWENYKILDVYFYIWELLKIAVIYDMGILIILIKIRTSNHLIERNLGTFARLYLYYNKPYHYLHSIWTGKPALAVGLTDPNKHEGKWI
jgi:hypothetical protein